MSVWRKTCQILTKSKSCTWLILYKQVLVQLRLARVRPSLWAILMDLTLPRFLLEGLGTEWPTSPAMSSFATPLQSPLRPSMSLVGGLLSLNTATGTYYLSKSSQTHLGRYDRKSDTWTRMPDLIHATQVPACARAARLQGSVQGPALRQRQQMEPGWG